MERPTPILVGSMDADMFEGCRRGERTEGRRRSRMQLLFLRSLFLRGGHDDSTRLYRPLFVILPLVPSHSHYPPSLTQLYIHQAQSSTCGGQWQSARDTGVTAKQLFKVLSAIHIKCWGFSCVY